MQLELHFSQSTPILEWGVRFSSVEAVYFQLIESSDGNHFPRGLEGFAVRIKYTLAQGSDISRIGEYKNINLVTSLNITLIS